MKLKLMLYNNGDIDKFEFKTLEDLTNFINEYIAEKLLDGNFARFKYDIKVEE